MAQDPSTQATPEATHPRDLLTTLRPQIYGKGAPDRIEDPIVEPLWVGVRALAGIGGDEATLIDQEGDTVEGFDEIIASLVDVARATNLILDGYVTKQAAQVAGTIAPWSDEAPSMGAFVGLRRNRAVDTLKLREDALKARSFDVDDEISYVATDLLFVDDETLFDVPLLERRRILESVLEESDVIRIGAFVRPPIGSWVQSWKAQGFGGLTYKAANSRYHPGEANPDWTVAGMPRR